MSAEADEDLSLLVELADLSPDEQSRALARLNGPQLREFYARWPIWAHDGQVAPPGDWRVWLIRAGRGFGKTRAGAEWVRSIAEAHPDARIALVGHTLDDAYGVMINGQSGLIAVAPDDAPVRWKTTTNELVFASGARAYVYSAEAPEKLRGPEHHFAWCDELAKWRDGDRAWDNLLLGLRLGDNPQVLVTTTPRPNALMRRVKAMDGLVETTGATRDNPHLPARFVAAMESDYGGTRLGRQELDGELIDDVEGALWTREGLETVRVRRRRKPAAVRVVVGVDPPAGIGGDACGIVAVMLAADGLAYVIEDASVSGLAPAGWARAVVRCARRHHADLVVAEVNNGGEMVKSVLAQAEATLPVRAVRASHGKAARAEPVSMLYEQDKVRHWGAFPALEDEMCGLSAAGYAGPGRSPDRADALVWALTELMLRRKRGVPAVRGL